MCHLDQTRIFKVVEFFLYRRSCHVNGGVKTAVHMGDVIADLPGVLHTSTFPVMEEVKDTHLLLIDGISPD